MLLGGRLLPACYHSYQCIGEFEPAAKPGRKSVQLAMLAPVENPIFADQQIYHKDPMSQNALIIWIPIRLSVAADFSIGSSISQSKTFDVELRKMDVELETRSSSEHGHPVRQRGSPLSFAEESLCEVCALRAGGQDVRAPAPIIFAAVKTRAEENRRDGRVMWETSDPLSRLSRYRGGHHRTVVEAGQEEHLNNPCGNCYWLKWCLPCRINLRTIFRRFIVAVVSF